VCDDYDVTLIKEFVHFSGLGRQGGEG
jgi:hypothetical protein